MSSRIVYLSSAGVSVLGVLLMVYGIENMVGPGIGGDIETVKRYFLVMCLGLFLALPSTILYYYQRAQTVTIGRLPKKTEVATLQAYGKRLKKHPKRDN